MSRNFLLFLPTHKQPGLKAVLSYYSSSVTLNAEGDTAISEETLQGLGMARQSRFPSLSVLFGAIFKIAEPPRNPNRPLSPDAIPSPVENTQLSPRQEEFQATPEAASIGNSPYRTIAAEADAAPEHHNEHLFDDSENSEEEERLLGEEIATDKKKLLLTEILPDPGYFAAGAVAGVVSRTATAPLDRLKVFLLTNVGPAKDSLDAVKKGDAAAVAKTVGRPLINATKELWNAGGIRSLFAGKLTMARPSYDHTVNSFQETV